MPDQPTIESLVQRILSLEAHKKVPLRVTEQDILRAQAELKIEFPPDYIAFILAINGVSFDAWELLRVWRAGEESVGFMWPDIVRVNQSQRRDAGMPDHLVAFAATGNGDYDCFDVGAGKGSDGEYAIVNWRHDEADPAEATLALEDSFIDWLAYHLAELE